MNFILVPACCCVPGGDCPVHPTRADGQQHRGVGPLDEAPQGERIDALVPRSDRRPAVAERLGVGEARAPVPHVSY